MAWWRPRPNKRMSDFANSTIGRLRALVGAQPLLCPVVRIFVEDADGRFLMQARGDYVGMWGLPGGNIELGESVVYAARRETLEETGLTLGEIEMFGYSSDPDIETMTLPNGHVCQYHAALLHCRNYTGTAGFDGEETVGIDWIDPDGEWPPVHAQIARSIEAYRQWRKTGRFQNV